VNGGAELGYQYVLLRCVPRVDREEFVNVGVVLYSQFADFLCSASRISAGRLLALDPGLDVEAVEAALAAIQAVCCASADSSDASRFPPAGQPLGQRFGWLAAPKSTVVQPGPVHGGLTTDPARQLELLLASLVG
jgi:hypothetical protein